MSHVTCERWAQTYTCTLMYNILTTTTMETTKMCLLELTKADAMVLANVIRRTANENPFHWKESSVEKTRDLYDNVLAQLYDYKY